MIVQKLKTQMRKIVVIGKTKWGCKVFFWKYATSTKKVKFYLVKLYFFYDLWLIFQIAAWNFFILERKEKKKLENVFLWEFWTPLLPLYLFCICETYESMFEFCLFFVKAFIFTSTFPVSLRCRLITKNLYLNPMNFHENLLYLFKMETQMPCTQQMQRIIFVAWQ